MERVCRFIHSVLCLWKDGLWLTKESIKYYFFDWCFLSNMWFCSKFGSSKHKKASVEKGIFGSETRNITGTRCRWTFSSLFHVICKLKFLWNKQRTINNEWKIIIHMTDLTHSFPSNGEHSHPLVPGLTPLVSIQIQTTNYLGPPYTNCHKEKGYSISVCHYKTMHRRIADICQCVPEYIPNIREIVQDATIKGCSFYEHSTCVSFLIMEFDKTKSDCLPACHDSVYHQAKIQVSKLLRQKNIYIINIR